MNINQSLRQLEEKLQGLRELYVKTDNELQQEEIRKDGEILKRRIRALKKAKGENV